MLRYTKGTCKFRILFLGLKKRQKVKGYIDLDYARDYIDCKSTYRSIFIFLRGLLAWYSRKQQSISTLTIEAEYVALCQGSKEVV